MNFVLRDMRSAALLLAFTFSLLSLSLGWMYVSPTGGTTLRVPYVLIPLLGLVLLAFPNRVAIALRYLASQSAIWLSIYIIYLLVLALKLAGMSDGGIIFRQVFFVVCAMTFGAAIIALGAAAKVLRYGAFLSIFVFILVTEWMARQIGLSWLVAFKNFITSGDFDFVTYEFLRELFRFSGPETLEVPASEKNLVAVALFTVLILFRAGHDGQGLDVLGWAVTALTVVVLVMLNTRSVLLVAGVSMVIAAGLAAVHRRKSVAQVLFAAVVAVAGLVAATVILSSDLMALSSLKERFAFDDASAGGRIQQIGFAISSIEQSTVVGSGLIEINGQLVHNLFLGAWMHAGLLAFLLVTSAYLIMLATWLGFMVSYVTKPEGWVLPLRAEWVAVLPVLFFFRVWIAGDAGHPGFCEWIGFFSFQSILIVNALAGRANAEKSFRLNPDAVMK